MLLPSPSPKALESPPTHVAIIMDGNGRWAKARGLPRALGHSRGADAVREVVEGCRELGVAYLTLYAFSSENWKRPAREVGDLMDLLRLYIQREIDDLRRNGVRLRVIGERAGLPADIVDLIESAEAATRHNGELNLIVALNYGSQIEIATACRRIAESVQAGATRPQDIDVEMIRRYLQTADIPDPDLLIRTSGEQRLSNFLLWQAAYAEFVFTDTLWPDFTRQSLRAAIDEYRRRERRYGTSPG